jgi:predicted aminopeptidase
MGAPGENYTARVFSGLAAALPRLVRPALLLLLAFLQAGCATVQYYSRSVAGHMEIVSRRRPIADLLADAGTPQDLREALAAVEEARAFAVRELLLPDNGSYRSYAQLDRPWLAWNVFAAPALSLEPVRWCFLFVGCLSYRGYFERADAERFAAGLREQGFDVYVGPVAAYSTLGWFADPVLDTMLRRGVPETARVLFHELAHQKLYIRDDTPFNEAFADTVALIGIRRWLATRPGEERERYLREIEFEEHFTALLMRYRERLASLYASPLDDAEKLGRKEALLGELRVEYARLRDEHGDPGTFDGWLRDGVNNAKLSAVSTYRELVPLFLERYRAADNDLRVFYAQVEGMKECDRDARLHWLRTGEKPSGC